LYRAADGCEELTDMDEETETKAIEKWLRMVDKAIMNHKMLIVFLKKISDHSGGSFVENDAKDS
jgi:C4-type Zn-finger protein